MDAEHAGHGAGEPVSPAAHVVEHAAVGHAAPHAASAIPEVPNAITVLSKAYHDQPIGPVLHRYENLFYGVLTAVALGLVAARFGRKPAMVPAKGQNVLEALVEGIDAFVQRVIGPAGRRHTPFIGSLFLYIWLMNLSGLIPGYKSATASLNTTVGLAVVVFGYVQWIGITANGPLKYFDHLAGSPRNVVGWCLVPLMLPLHVLGEFIKPLSLSLRLGFNVFAEDVLLAVLLGLGATAGLALHLPGWLPIPLQVVVVPLVLIFSTVQALVFSLLASVYIALMSPHDEHHAEPAH